MTGCGKSKETATEKIAEPNVTIKSSKENSEEKETDEIRAKEEESNHCRMESQHKHGRKKVMLHVHRNYKKRGAKYGEQRRKY